MIPKIVQRTLSFGLHLVAVGLIIYAVRPVVRWYMDQIPARGVDLYLTGSYVMNLWHDFSWRFNGWKDIWFSGVPLALDYSSLYFYFALPLVMRMGLIPGIQTFAIVGLAVFLVASYGLYFELSRNYILSWVLAVATIWSANLYRSLVWAGGVPFWTTQSFFPLVMLWLVKYCRSQNRKWLLLGALTAGIAMLGHPQNVVNVIIPTALILVLCYRPYHSVSLKSRLLDLTVFVALTILVALPEFSIRFNLIDIINYAGNLFHKIAAPPVSTGGESLASPLEADIAAWTQAQFHYAWQDTNQYIWVLAGVGLGLFLLTFGWQKHKKRLVAGLAAFIGMSAWVIGLVYLMSRGIDLFVTGWYKAYWPILVGVPMLAAYSWGEAKRLVDRFGPSRFGLIVKYLIWLISYLAIAIGAYLILWPSSRMIIPRLEQIDSVSSAYPETMNMRYSQTELNRLVQSLYPNMMRGNEHDYRLYTVDATVNIWWGALQPVALTRGYVDPPLTTSERWGIFWMDSALGPGPERVKSSLVEDWHTPEWVADNNVRFLLDWYATKYLEGNHTGAAASTLAGDVTSEKFISATESLSSRGGITSRYNPDERWDDSQVQQLNFYQVKDDLVSPILTATDTPAVLHIGNAQGYDTLTRLLGAANLGPRQMILIKGPEHIDQVKYSELKRYPAVILYQYDYRNYANAWKTIENYATNGGHVFIDTGSEVKESDSIHLPDNFPSELPSVFPIRRTVRENLGQAWQADGGDDPITQGINFQSFSPLVFNQETWNISHPAAQEDVREGSKIILSQKGIPVVAARELGKGKVIWSGFNHPYHAIRDYNQAEIDFAQNILNDLVGLKVHPILSEGKWINSRRREITIGNAKGVLFKEQGFSGWKATINGKRLPIELAGPSTPGFMYVPIPDNLSGDLVLTYQGSTMSKVTGGVSIITTLLIIDFLIFGRLMTKTGKLFLKPFHKKVLRWWEKDTGY